VKENIKISPIKEMEIRSSRILNVVSLAQGIPSFDTPLCIKNKAIEAIQDGRVARYSLSPGILELREAIEYSLAKRNIFYDFEKEIIVTAGSIEAITASFLAILEPGDEVLIPDPTYTSYQSSIKTARGVPIFVPLDEENDWSFNIEEFKKRITPKTKAILYCNPNNPTGTVYSRQQLMQLAEIAQIHNLYILADEVYKDFIYSKEDFFSLAQFSALRKRFIYIFSFSKSYAMTGWRVAYLATDRALAEKILGVHDALVTCAPVVSQWGALAALEMADVQVEEYKEIFNERRNLLCEELDKLADWFEYQTPSSAYFVFPKMTNKLIIAFNKYESRKNAKQTSLKDYQKKSISWRFAIELLESAKVALVPGVAFGEKGENHLRFCFGRRKESIEEAMKRITKFIKLIS
jgi:aspartate/methionine/tyrosine aminotransferase